MPDAPTPYGPYALICQRCGGVFYWLTRCWEPHTILTANICVHTDGTPVMEHEVMVCGTCGQAPPLDEHGNVARFPIDAVVASEQLQPPTHGLS